MKKEVLKLEITAECETIEIDDEISKVIKQFCVKYNGITVTVEQGIERFVEIEKAINKILENIHLPKIEIPE